MTAIILATRNEASRLMHRLSAVKDSGIYHHRGNLAGRSAALYVCRPGVASKEQLRRFLRLHQYDRVILAGCSASLTSTLQHLQCVRVAQAISPGEKMLSLANTGVRSVSVRHLVTDDATKADLYAQTKAEILDMETYTVAHIMTEQEFSALPLTSLRIVDDLPGEENYLNKERMLREMTLRTPTGNPTIAQILRFGVWDYLRILQRRRRVSAAVGRAVIAELAGTDIPDRE